MVRKLGFLCCPVDILSPLGQRSLGPCVCAPLYLHRQTVRPKEIIMFYFTSLFFLYPWVQNRIEQILISVAQKIGNLHWKTEMKWMKCRIDNYINKCKNHTHVLYMYR